MLIGNIVTVLLLTISNHARKAAHWCHGRNQLHHFRGNVCAWEHPLFRWMLSLQIAGPAVMLKG